jgi:pyroglutamyl-peptidase
MPATSAGMTERRAMTTILLTGFGPFPGAPFNPTGPLVARLARLRGPALAGVTIVPHVFPTSYAAVDRELPALLRKHKPDAVLMFGLATRTPHIRIETRARNAYALIPDATGLAPQARGIATAGPPMVALPAPARRLLAAARAARVPVALSRDAGRYLCNYLCWRAAEAARRPKGPRLAAFVHVPLVQRGPMPRLHPQKHHLTLADLLRAGGALLRVTATAVRR